MRIVVLGDFHMNKNELEMTRAAMEDIKASQPDLVVSLGDLGIREHSGTPQGLQDGKEMLDLTGAPLRAIMGNHDLERESGAGSQEKGTMEREFVQLFGTDSYGVMEFDDYRLFFVTTDPQPEDSCYQIQECYVSEGQYEWLMNELNKRKGVPIIFFTHAPPIGCGLRTVPNVHVRSTNAYLDQNHDPIRWINLVKDTPEIVMWFSAHYHLGHHHPDSHTLRYGTHFFITGVHGSCTRDESRQSRVIDITPDGTTVRTLDHVKREISDIGLWKVEGKLSTLMDSTTKCNKIDCNVTLKDTKNYINFSVTSIPAGLEPAINGGVIPLDEQRYLVACKDGYTWELNAQYEALLGTLHINKQLSCIAASPTGIWSAWDRTIVYHHPQQLERFVRTMDDNEETEYSLTIHMEDSITCLAMHHESGVWVGVSRSIWHVDTNHDIRKALTLQHLIKSMKSNEHGIYILDQSNRISYWNIEKNELTTMYDNHCYAMDMFKDERAVIALRHSNPVLKIDHLSSQYEFRLPFTADNIDEENIQIICLDNKRALILNGGMLYYCDGPGTEIIRLESIQGVTAIARTIASNPNQVQFCASVTPIDETSRPNVQFWTKS